MILLLVKLYSADIHILKIRYENKTLGVEFYVTVKVAFKAKVLLLSVSCPITDVGDLAQVFFI